MKVGITGARGFLGAAIAKEAKRRRWKVVAFSRSDSKPVDYADEVRLIDDTESLDFSDLDALIHLAGEPIVGWWSTDKKRRIHNSRVDLTSDIVEALSRISRNRRPEVFVSASAIGIYGDRSDEWLDEEADAGFGFIPQVCRDWEYASNQAERLGIRVVTPRIGLVLGEKGLLKRLRLIFWLGLGGRLGTGKQWMSWIHIDDLAGLFAKCVIEKSISGRVNCVAPKPVPNSEFTRVYARILGRKAIFPVPRFILRRLPGGMGCLFLDSQRVEPVVMKAFGFEWKFSTLESALLDIENSRKI
tara:strand:- start:3373 stop:4275 length:903 start_codon:yes stop_codon:yes gene_type:complete